MTRATRSIVSDRAYAALSEIRFNLVLIEDFVGGFTFEVFEREWKTRYATLHALGIIYEASDRLPAELKERHPSVSWDAMRNAGVQHRQDRDPLSASRLWRVAVEEMPLLQTIVAVEHAATNYDSNCLETRHS